MIKAAILCRVSTGRQVDNTSLDDQVQKGTAEAKRLGWSVVMVERDEGISGGDLDRPALNAVMEASHRGEIDALIVYHQDRLARDETVRHLIERDLRQLGIKYRPLNLPANVDPFDEAEGEMTAGVFGVIAQYQRRQNQWRSANGQRAKAREGRWPGGAPPYGYRLEGKAKDVRPVPNPDERQIIDLVYGWMVGDNKTTGEVAALLNGLGYRRRSGAAWTHQIVLRQFRTEGIKGQVWWGKPTRAHNAGHHTRRLPDGTPKYGDPIELQLSDPPLTEEQWESLQRALNRRAYGLKRDAKPYPLSGTITACGGRLGGVWRADRDLRQYRCNRAKWNASGEPRCDCQRINADWLDGQIWSEVVSVLTDPDRLLRMASDYLGLRATIQPAEQTSLREVEAKILKLERARVQQAKDALVAGVPGEILAEAIAEIEAELVALREYARTLQQRQAVEQAESDRAVELARLAQFAAERCGQMSLDEQGQVLRLLQVSVTLLDPSETPGAVITGVVPGGGPEVLGSPSVTGGSGDPQNEVPRSHVARVTTPGLPFRVWLAA